MKLKISNIPTSDNIPHNFSPGVRKALRELQCNADLVINKADKGSTIVVQDRTDYVRLGLEHLSDPDTYRELDGNLTSFICSDINLSLLQFYCSPKEW